MKKLLAALFFLVSDGFLWMVVRPGFVGGLSASRGAIRARARRAASRKPSARASCLSSRSATSRRPVRHCLVAARSSAISCWAGPVRTDRSAARDRARCGERRGMSRRRTELKALLVPCGSRFAVLMGVLLAVIGGRLLSLLCGETRPEPRSGIGITAVLDYLHLAGLRGSSAHIDPGAYKFRMGAVPDRARGLGHMVPTYNRRDHAGSTAPRPSRLCTLLH